MAGVGGAPENQSRGGDVPGLEIFLTAPHQRGDLFRVERWYRDRLHRLFAVKRGLARGLLGLFGQPREPNGRLSIRTSFSVRTSTAAFHDAREILGRIGERLREFARRKPPAVGPKRSTNRKPRSGGKSGQERDFSTCPSIERNTQSKRFIRDRLAILDNQTC